MTIDCPTGYQTAILPSNRMHLVHLLETMFLSFVRYAKPANNPSNKKSHLTTSACPAPEGTHPLPNGSITVHERSKTFNLSVAYLMHTRLSRDIELKRKSPLRGVNSGGWRKSPLGSRLELNSPMAGLASTLYVRTKKVKPNKKPRKPGLHNLMPLNGALVLSERPE